MPDDAHLLEAWNLLDASGISKAFPGVQALDDAQISVRYGSVHALLGENGAGKSTLMNILAGVCAPDSGQILLEGKPVSFRSPRDAQQSGIAIIFQELNLVPEMSVAENIFLGREPRNAFGFVDYRKMHERARELLSALNVTVDPTIAVARLRVGTQQVVEIAKALSIDARVLIMDEPTSALSNQEAASLFSIIGQLKQRGIGIIYITHKLDELPQIADDVTVMRDGRFIATRSFGELTHDELVRMMVGRERLAEFAKTATVRRDSLLQVRDLSLRHPDRPQQSVVRKVTFEVARGEVLGLFGLMGAGRTELLKAIFGVYPGDCTGAVIVEGKAVTIRSPRDAIRAGIALAPEDRKAEGLVLDMSVVENAGLASLDGAVRLGVLQPLRELQLVGKYMDRMAVKAPSPWAPVRNLSGGNQQKVVLSKWLATEPKVLLLDEPTRGIDVGAKREIYALIDELARDGLAVVIASSELPEIMAIADRILVLSEGRVTGEFERGAATEELILNAALPTKNLQEPANA